MKRLHSVNTHRDPLLAGVYIHPYIRVLGEADFSLCVLSLFIFFFFLDMQFWYKNDSMEGLSALSLVFNFVCEVRSASRDGRTAFHGDQESSTCMFLLCLYICTFSFSTKLWPVYLSIDRVYLSLYIYMRCASFCMFRSSLQASGKIPAVSSHVKIENVKLVDGKIH